jgi:hypothetical protein
MLALQPAPLADGPAMFFGSTIMTFALPYGAFIAAAIALFYLFRARHSGPRLRWSSGSPAPVASVTTWEPGPAAAPAAGTAAGTASPVSAASVPTAPHVVPDRIEEDVLAETAPPAEASTAEAPASGAPAVDETAVDETATDDEANGADGEEA